MRVATSACAGSSAMRNIRTISTGWAELEVGSMFGAYLQARLARPLGRRFGFHVLSAARRAAYVGTLFAGLLANLSWIMMRSDERCLALLQIHQIRLRISGCPNSNGWNAWQRTEARTRCYKPAAPTRRLNKAKFLFG